jgi:hypothetical protein
VVVDKPREPLALMNVVENEQDTLVGSARKGVKNVTDTYRAHAFFVG